MHRLRPFKVTVVADGGASFTSGFYYLQNGCPGDNPDIVTASSQTLQLDVLIDSSNTGVFTFVNPTTNLTYCEVIKNELINRTRDGADKSD